MALSAEGNKAVNTMLNFNNVISQISSGIDYGNSKISPVVEKVMPSQSQLLDTRMSLGMPGAEIHTILRNNDWIRQYSSAATEVYDYVREKPVDTGIAIAATYAGGEVFGAATELATLGIESAGARLALSAIAKDNAIIKSVGSGIANYARPAINTALVTDLGYNGVKTLMQGDMKKDLEFFGNLAIAGKSYEKGVEAVREPVSIVPGLHSVNVKEVSSGALSNTRNINVGTSLEIAGKTIASKDYNGIHWGEAEINPDTVRSKQVQPFDERGTNAYLKYVENSKIISDNDKIYQIAGMSVADAAYNAKNPIVTPKSFDILGKDVPEQFRPVLKDTIVKFGSGISTKLSENISKLTGNGDFKIQVAGSNAQKLQMGKYFSREIGDLEIYTKKPTEFVNKFIQNAEKAGLKENVHFKIENKGTTTPKISFKTENGFSKGVEIFTPEHKVVENVTKEEANEYSQGWQSQSGIAYNKKELNSIIVDNTKLQKVQEQASRKYAGATTLKDNTIVPVHEGRIKDARDLAEIGIGNKVVLDIGNTKDVIDYAKAVAKKYPQVIDKSLGDEKAYSPIIEFVVKNDRFPTEKEIDRLSRDYTPSGEKEILFTNESKGYKDLMDKIVETNNKLSSLSTRSTRQITEFSKGTINSNESSKSTSLNNKTSKTNSISALSSSSLQSIKSMINNTNEVGSVVFKTKNSQKPIKSKSSVNSKQSVGSKSNISSKLSVSSKQNVSSKPSISNISSVNSKSNVSNKSSISSKQNIGNKSSVSNKSNINSKSSQIKSTSVTSKSSVSVISRSSLSIKGMVSDINKLSNIASKTPISQGHGVSKSISTNGKYLTIASKRPSSNQKIGSGKTSPHSKSNPISKPSASSKSNYTSKGSTLPSKGSVSPSSVSPSKGSVSPSNSTPSKGGSSGSSKSQSYGTISSYYVPPGKKRPQDVPPKQNDNTKKQLNNFLKSHRLLANKIPNLESLIGN